MFGNFMGKMQEAQKKMEEIKLRLNNVYLDGEAENGKVKATANGNRELLNIQISSELVIEGDAEAISELVLLAVNRALEKAKNVNETELQSAAKSMLPSIPGMF